MPKEGEDEGEDEGVSIVAFQAKILAWMDRVAVPIAGLVAAGLLALAAWLVFGPVAEEPAPAAPPAPELYRLLSSGAIEPQTADGRRAAYVSDTPDDGTPEPPLHTHDREGASR